MIQAIPTRNPEASQALKTLLVSELIGQHAITLDDGEIYSRCEDISSPPQDYQVKYYPRYINDGRC